MYYLHTEYGTASVYHTFYDQIIQQGKYTGIVMFNKCMMQRSNINVRIKIFTRSAQLQK